MWVQIALIAAICVMVALGATGFGIFFAVFLVLSLVD